eukprot:11725449-Alexandrium_andersonii.AAC.1
MCCAADEKAAQNLKNVAIRDGEEEWFDAQMAMADQRERLVDKYHEKVGAQTAKNTRIKLPTVLG